MEFFGDEFDEDRVDVDVYFVNDSVYKVVFVFIFVVGYMGRVVRWAWRVICFNF